MIKILITGDFCPIGKTQELAVQKNFDAIYNDFMPVLKAADLAVTNLECPLIDTDVSRAKTGPALKAPTSTIEVLKHGGFHLVTMANNHIMDQQAQGLNSTIKLCDENNISYVGVGKNLTDARKPFINEINGKKICILNFAENEFSNTHGDYPGANPLSLVSNFNDIKSARKEADYLIVVFHGGNEMHPLPSPRVKETLRFFADCGADAVIAHHTHCVSGYENYNGTLIFYGLGNFLFDYHRRKDNLWTKGLAVQLNLEGSKASFELIPFYQNKEEMNGIHLLNNDEKRIFEDELKKFNLIIADDSLLEKEFQKYVEKKKKMYSHYLEPYTQRILHIMHRYKLLPSFLNKRKRLLYLNLIRCESHRDVILRILGN